MFMKSVLGVICALLLLCCTDMLFSSLRQCVDTAFSSYLLPFSTATFRNGLPRAPSLIGPPWMLLGRKEALKTANCKMIWVASSSHFVKSSLKKEMKTYWFLTSQVLWKQKWLAKGSRYLCVLEVSLLCQGTEKKTNWLGVLSPGQKAMLAEALAVCSCPPLLPWEQIQKSHSGKSLMHFHVKNNHLKKRVRDPQDMPASQCQVFRLAVAVGQACSDGRMGRSWADRQCGTFCYSSGNFLKQLDRRCRSSVFRGEWVVWIPLFWRVFLRPSLAQPRVSRLHAAEVRFCLLSCLLVQGFSERLLQEVRLVF